jgi:hypothetical protein
MSSTWGQLRLQARLGVVGDRERPQGGAESAFKAAVHDHKGRLYSGASAVPTLGASVEAIAL